LAIGALLCGFIAAVIATNNGRDAKNGFYLGLLLGPVGIVIAW